MERRTLFAWLIGISFVGILCIFALGRPTSDIATVPVPAGYTPAPVGSTVPPSLVAELATAAGKGVATKLTGSTATLTPVVDPRNQSVDSTPPTGGEMVVADPTLSMAPAAPFNVASVLNAPLRESIGTIAKNIPGATIRPYPLGTALPPGPALESRVNVQYDPSTLTVTQVTYG